MKWKSKTKFIYSLEWCV